MANPTTSAPLPPMQGPPSPAGTGGKADNVQNMLVEAFKGDTLSASLVGWGIIFVVLMFLASFDSTAPIAAAFAWLIFVAVALINAEKILGGGAPAAKTGG